MKNCPNSIGKFAVIGLISILAITGCTEEAAEPAMKTPTEKVKTTLKVAYFNQQQFMRDYGDTLKKLLPDIEFQVIPSIQVTNSFAMPIDSAKIMEQKPDLLSGGPLIMELSNSGKAMELSSLIKQEAFDMNVFTELAVEQMRQMGNGKLTNLSPTFMSTATFYNKEKFDRLGVAYPTNNMSWASMMELAKKFVRNENGKQHYGIYTITTPLTMVSLYADGVGAPFVSEDRRTVNYTSGAPRAAANTAIDAYRSGILYLPPEKNEGSVTKTEAMLRNKFISGEAALAFYNPSLLGTMTEAAGLGIPSFKWDIVTEPVNPAKTGQSSFGIFISDPFAIAADSPNKAAAWEVIKTITGTAMAAELAKTKPHLLSTRKDTMLAFEGRKLDAFYAHTTVMGGEGWPQQLAQQVNLIYREEMNDILYDRKTVDVGLSAVQTRVQQAIDGEFAAKK
ncbi:extracellular solute-binding protein [Paenibacillus hemerocallicola]|uniref:Extracellular solute-binding protein n=1 Tax=Paenibacillus hemerocallicola TaxID=1172614 RepID=A0A5C4TEQ3_9BACL|nr:extracellular solute-binding protein [Paenibacillus hemerocallicola]TNJ67458.1 extracellular solute-binding protein [Paenibacillus hemerocallicola]